VCILITASPPCLLAGANYMVFAFGSSTKTNPDSAGKEAARAAIGKVGAAVPRLAMVLNALGDGTETGVLNGVSMVVADTSIIVGSNGPSLFTESGRTEKVIVWVAAGPGAIHKAAASYSGTTSAAIKTCGSTIGTALKAVTVPAGDGSLVILFGGCDYARDSLMVEGIVSAMGADAPLIGMSSVSSAAEVFSGKRVLPVSGSVNTNMGVLLHGAFSAHFGYVTTAGTTSIDQAVRDGYNAAKTAVTQGPAGRKPDAMLFFDCTGRRTRLGGNTGLARELDTLRAAAGPNVPFSGIYCYGEIGKANDNTKAVGLHLSLSACALYAHTSQTSLAAAAPRHSAPEFTVRMSGTRLVVCPPFASQWTLQILTPTGAVVKTQPIGCQTAAAAAPVTLPCHRYVVRLSDGVVEMSRALPLVR
jgi:hypothetical protein